jgi:ribonuclease HI
MLAPWDVLLSGSAATTPEKTPVYEDDSDALLADFLKRKNKFSSEWVLVSGGKPKYVRYDEIVEVETAEDEPKYLR